jgi:hypothetical protein
MGLGRRTGLYCTGDDGLPFRIVDDHSRALCGVWPHDSDGVRISSRSRWSVDGAAARLRTGLGLALQSGDMNRPMLEESYLAPKLSRPDSGS